MSLQAHIKDQFNRSSDEELAKVVAAYGPDRPEGAYCASILARRHAARIEEIQRQVHSKLSVLDSIDARLGNVEREAKKPAYKTWAFWLAVFAFIIAVYALLRDYWEIKGTP